MVLNWHCFDDRDVCAAQLAKKVGGILTASQTKASHALALLAGGSTPRAFFASLAAQPLDWSRLMLSPTDERWVPVDDPNSNTRLLKEAFPKAGVIDPRQASDRASSAPLWGRALSEYAPAAVCLLGMGEDGHFASLFAGMPHLARALDLNAPPGAVLAQAPTAPCARLSLNLAWLTQATWLGLLIYGEHKKALLEQAIKGDKHLPVRALVGQAVRNLEIYWAP